jgi:hypothetical protein
VGSQGSDYQEISLSTKVVWYRDRFEVLQHAAAIAPVDGLVCEFGVATGGTIHCLAGSTPLQGRTIYGFDSFKGLPEPWSGLAAGHFACQPPQVPDNVRLVIGWFSQSLAPFLAKHPGDAALLHIDSDLYDSARCVLDHFTPRIVAGTVIVFDEYFITGQERRAFREWLEKTGRGCRYEARSLEQLCLIIE